MNGICCACLSSDRTLSTIPDVHWKILEDTVVPMASKNHQKNFILLRKVLKTCWECHTRIQGIIRFRRKALVGLEYMTQFYSVGASPSALSSLSVSNINITSFNDAVKLEFEVADESEIKVPSVPIKQDIHQDIYYPIPVISDPLHEEFNIKTESDISTDDADIESMLSSSVICKIEDTCKGGENNQDNTKISDLKMSNKTVTISMPLTSQIQKINTSEINNETMDEVYQPPLHQISGTNKFSLKTVEKNLLKIEVMPLNTTNKHILPAQIDKNATIAPKLQIPVNKSVANEPNLLEQGNKSVTREPTLLRFLLNNVKSLPKAPNFTGNNSVSNKIVNKIPNELRYIPSDAERKPDNIVPSEKISWYRKVYSEEQVIEQFNEKRKSLEFSESKYKCVGCVLVFEDDNGLKEHLEECHNEKNSRYVCPICTQRFRAIDYLLKIHMRVHCDKYVCLSCNYEAPSVGVVMLHKCNTDVQHLSGNISWRAMDVSRKKRVYKCRSCDATFKSASSRYSHFIYKHQPKQKVQCHLCDTILGSKISLKSHIKRKHECEDTLENMASYCKPCGLRFNNKYTYEYHLKSSLKHLKPEDLKFVCAQCNRRFLRKSGLEKHIDRVHLKTKGAFECDKCSRAFHFKRLLVEHIRTKHENIPVPRKFICEVCAETFTTGVILKHHMYRHTGERPYKCKKCPSTFGYGGALFMHNKLVHEKVKMVWKKKTGKMKKNDVKEKRGRKKASKKE